MDPEKYIKFQNKTDRFVRIIGSDDEGYFEVFPALRPGYACRYYITSKMKFKVQDIPFENDLLCNGVKEITIPVEEQSGDSLSLTIIDIILPVLDLSQRCLEVACRGFHSKRQIRAMHYPKSLKKKIKAYYRLLKYA